MVQLYMGMLLGGVYVQDGTRFAGQQLFEINTYDRDYFCIARDIF